MPQNKWIKPQIHVTLETHTNIKANICIALLNGENEE